MGSGQCGLHPRDGVQHGRKLPDRLPLCIAGEGARGDPHTCRSAVHPHLRSVRHLRTAAAGVGSPSSAVSSVTFSSTICGSRNTRSPFPTSRRSLTRGSKTPASSAGSSPVGMKRAGRINTTAGSTRARWCRRHWRASRQYDGKLCRKDQADGKGAAAPRSDIAASALRLPDPAPPPRCLHARHGGARRVRQSRRSTGKQFGPRTHGHHLLRRRVGPIIRPASR